MKTPASMKRRAQRGAALITALILLLVITVMAMSMMGSSRLELMMAGNRQFSLLAFQAAQSAIEIRVAADDFSTGATPTPQTHDYSTAMGTTATSTVAYLTATDVPAGGYSLGSGFQAYHFTIGVVATAPRGATSSQTQGLYIVGPGS